MTALIRSPSKSDYWWIVTLSVLAVAAIGRLVASTWDPLDYDSYRLMMGVDKPFSEYYRISGFGFPLIVHYWLSYRVFGGSLSGYLVLPLMSGLATLLVVYYGLRRYWYATSGICFFTLVVLAFNNFSWYFARYPMFTFANNLFVSTLLFFLFLRLSMGKLTRRQWIWITACIIPAAFFTDLILVVPIATGVLSVIAFRWWQSPTGRRLKNLWQSLIEMWPLAIFPLTYVVTMGVLTPDVWARAHKSSLDRWYFSSSEYANDLWGPLQFVYNNTLDLYKALLQPVRDVLPNVDTVILIVLGISGMILVIRIVQRRLEPEVAFTLIFVILTSCAIAVGGLLGLYPFGSPRYAYYLLIPIAILIGYTAAILIGYTASLVFKWSPHGIKKLRYSKALPVIAAMTVLFFGAYVNVQAYNFYSDLTFKNHVAMQNIRNNNADIVVFSSYVFPVLAVKAPHLYESGYSMGWGGGDVPNELVEMVTGSYQAGSVKSILVIDYNPNAFANRNPHWYQFIEMHFDQVDFFRSSAIWAGYFVKK